VLPVVLSAFALTAIGAAPAVLAAPPIAGDDSRSFQTGLGDSSTSGPQAVGALANDSDPDLDFFTVVSVTQPGFGTAGITANGLDVTYSPTLTRGTTSFTYTIEDINGEQDTATVTVTVTNRPPEAENPSVSTPFGVPVSFGVVVIGPPDPEGDDVIISSFQDPPNGTAVIDGGLGFHTTRSADRRRRHVRFHARRSAGGTDTGTVTVTITPNNAPVAQNDIASTRSGPSAGLQVPIPVLLNDDDPDGPVHENAFTVDIPGSPPANGTIDTITPGGVIRYTPNPGFSGNDVFTYLLDDSFGLTDTATVTVTVTADALPVANPDSAQTSQDTPLAISVLDNDTDADDVLSNNDLELTQPANGSVSQSCLGNCLPPEYTPNSTFVGTDTFTYRVLDPLGGASNFTTVTVQVIDQLPPPPDAVDDAAQTFKNETITINVLDNDLNVTTIAALTTPPSQGGTVAILNQVQVQYTPPQDFRGTETFQYQVQTVSGIAPPRPSLCRCRTATVAADDSASTTAALRSRSRCWRTTMTTTMTSCRSRTSRPPRTARSASSEAPSSTRRMPDSPAPTASTTRSTTRPAVSTRARSP
jgi:hypothetical protein